MVFGRQAHPDLNFCRVVFLSPVCVAGGLAPNVRQGIPPFVRLPFIHRPISWSKRLNIAVIMLEGGLLSL
jgi:hypothetical protein